MLVQALLVLLSLHSGSSLSLSSSAAFSPSLTPATLRSEAALPGRYNAQISLGLGRQAVRRPACSLVKLRAQVQQEVRPKTASEAGSKSNDGVALGTANPPTLESGLAELQGDLDSLGPKLARLTVGNGFDFSGWKTKIRIRPANVYAIALLMSCCDVLVVSFLRMDSGELLVERYPLIVNALQGALLTLSGDSMCQAFTGRRDENEMVQIDTIRSCKAGLVGIPNAGLWPYYWYFLVDKFVPDQVPLEYGAPEWSSAGTMLVCKILLDSVFNGAFSICSSFTLWSMMDRDTVPQWKRKFEKSFWETWIMDWKTWPLYNVVCFSVIPLQFRPMTSGIASSVWNAYISHQSQQVED